METPMLEMRQISKSFNGIKVLDQVHFELRKGEVHALMGGNGAGKSTLMKILTGVYELDAGSIHLDGAEVQIKTPNDAEKQGISMIFQEFSLIPTLTVAQNIYIGREPRTAWGFIDDKKCVQMAAQLLEELNVDIKPNDLVADLGVGYWQMTEIAKALAKETKILIMDEPTSSLTKRETEILFDFIGGLKRKGYSIIYISHRMEEIFQICDRITIMGDGRHIITADTNELDMDSVIQHIAGKNLDKFEWKQRKQPASHKVILQVKNLKTNDRVNGIDFELKHGEIVGIAGLMGSGRSETLRALFGIDSITEGEIHIKGKKVAIRSPKDAIHNGLALVPEDRRVQGLVLDHEVKDNILLPSLSKITNVLVNDRKGNQMSEEWVKKLNIKTDSIYKKSRLLSGGNQQKIVFAKWLANSPEIIMLDEPTIGIDIRAKTEIIDMVRDLADEGKSILLVSSEMTELLAVSDRILVFHEGKVVKQFMREEINSEENLQHAIQGF
ncbi:sugar ABC transporter ATP-binding protein [Paenibacillus validus]|uniref:ATP-binding cassette domain-containing protein n=1 Tax=Paenibacillus validus TaxID=44253 RepID=A0A7X2ZDN7_9BACL|nr:MULTISPECIES: sugar ABC transporter ATP-binding protein [Paenibacillus]MED4601405.1 sugar ABC transporter ATP-binding protein [Paenibacillus validus]MED4605050.1 sugar ABC transporter ATP-binding protein [Paenibacillus validus]MUG72903.1 ATP-binding cassette domain-containing protein [Paenibacillus validus]